MAMINFLMRPILCLLVLGIVPTRHHIRVHYAQSFTLVPNSSGPQRFQHQRPCNTRQYDKREEILIFWSSSSSSSDDDASDGSLSSFSMDSLRSRMEQVADQDTKLPIVVIDTMLPRQVLKIEANEDSFTRLVKTQLEKETPVFGMVGLATLRTGQTLPLQNGVEVEIVGIPKVVVDEQQGTTTTTTPRPLGLRVELKAGRRFRITGELDTAKEGWTQARVRFLDSKQEEEAEEKGPEPISLARAMSLAREFTAPNVNMKDNKSLVDRWIELARENEKNPGQIDQLLKDLGKIPPVTEPSERAFWVGALINPLPGMGVAMEIRPQLLMARTAEERVGTAIAGILASIRHMDGTKTLF